MSNPNDAPKPENCGDRVDPVLLSLPDLEAARRFRIKLIEQGLRMMLAGEATSRPEGIPAGEENIQ